MPLPSVAINSRAAIRGEIGGVERVAREMVSRLPQMAPGRYRGRPGACRPLHLGADGTRDRWCDRPAAYFAGIVNGPQRGPCVPSTFFSNTGLPARSFGVSVTEVLVTFTSV